MRSKTIELHLVYTHNFPLINHIMKKQIIFTSLLCGAMMVSAAGLRKAATALDANPGLQEAPVITFDGFRKINILNATADGPAVDFTIVGGNALTPVFAESFENGIAGWVNDPASADITWTTKDMGGDKSFSKIRPGDGASLYVDGPYQTFKRAISSLTSSPVNVEDKATLTFYAGYSLNYNDVASLTLEVSEDNFETAVKLWSSLDETGNKVWEWRYVSIDMSRFAGKQVKFRFTYGPGTDDLFQTGGYLGDFAIDAFELSVPSVVDHVDVMTGEKINLLSLAPEGVTYDWQMPGAVPATSTEANPEIYYTRDGSYDISLTVTDASGKSNTVTRRNFATVTGFAPTAHIIPPAMFRSSSNRKPLVAPLVPVTYRDGSTGFPETHEWMFTQADADPDKVVTSTESDPVVSYPYLHDKLATLQVSNQHGTSTDMCEVTVEYSSVVTNMRPDDNATTFDMGDWGVFPGSNNRKITAYAERFSAPSRPVMIDGAYVYFTKAQAEEITDQIANVGVHLYTSENGKPGKRLDSFWWSVFELDLPTESGTMVGTSFPFTEAPIVNDEFFIVVDGIPEVSETCCVSFGMAGFRGEGSTALMLKDGEWIDVADYFPIGSNHTSYMIYPSVHHSVMASLYEGGEEVTVGPAAGVFDYPIFSYMGYESPVKSDSEWLRTTGTANGMTVDDIHIEYDALPAGVSSRTGILTLTDGASELPIKVVQSRSTAVTDIADSVEGIKLFPEIFTDIVRVYGVKAGDKVKVVSVNGQVLYSATATEAMIEIPASDFPAGVCIITVNDTAVKGIKK